MRPLTLRERRLVALGLLVLCIAIVWLAGVAPVINGFQARADERRRLIARQQAGQRLLASIPALRAEAAQQRRSAALYQIAAPTQALASEALGRRLAAALAQPEAIVGAVQPVLADVPAGWISVRADAVINLTQLIASIHQLENETPYVVVDYTSLGADRALRSGHSAPLDVRLQISAVFRAAPVR